MEPAPPKRPTLGSLIPIVTGLVALVGAVVYAIMRYSYQRFYDLVALTPDDVGPNSAAALTQSGVRVATFVGLFAFLPAALALLVSQGFAKLLTPDFSRLMCSGPERSHLVTRLRAGADLLLPIVSALALYRGFTAATNGSRELNELIILAIAVLLLTAKRYAKALGSEGSYDFRRNRLEASFVRATNRVPSTGWIVAIALSFSGALALAGSLPRDARTTARLCLIVHDRPVRWIHTHRTFFGVGNLNHMAVLQVRADPARMFWAKDLSKEPLTGFRRLVYLGDAGGRDFMFDRKQQRTLQIPDSSVVIATSHARHCHWWRFHSKGGDRHTSTSEAWRS
jgi:hypothetical protein